MSVDPAVARMILDAHRAGRLAGLYRYDDEGDTLLSQDETGAIIRELLDQEARA